MPTDFVAAVAGAEAILLRPACDALHGSGGRNLLSAPLRTAVRRSLRGDSRTALSRVPGVSIRAACTAVGSAAARTAALGFVVDGSAELFTAIAEEDDALVVARRTGRAAAIGAVAGAAGVAVAAAMMTATGPLSAPATYTFASTTTTAVRRILDDRL